MRQPMVTRTIPTTKATCLCINLETNETFEKEVILPRTYTKDSKMLDMAQKIGNTETTKVIHIKSSEVVETLYGMLESDFINSDKVQILPSRTKNSTEEN